MEILPMVIAGFLMVGAVVFASIPKRNKRLKSLEEYLGIDYKQYRSFIGEDLGKKHSSNNDGKIKDLIRSIDNQYRDINLLEKYLNVELKTDLEETYYKKITKTKKKK